MEAGRLGKCHVCGFNALVKFCPLCDHWFCKGCRTQYFKRGLEAVKQLVQGKQPGCCGPLED